MIFLDGLEFTGKPPGRARSIISFPAGREFAAI
jgi:hypothetical protein